MADDLTQYSFDELVEEISNRLSTRGNWGDAYNSSQGQTLVQLFADSVEQLHYYLERRTQENYFPTARLDSSIKGLASSVAYSPRRNVSSNGFLTLTVEDGDGNTITPDGNINIPRYTQIQLEDTIFVNVEDLTIEPDQSSVNFQVIEGTPQSEVFSPNDTDTIFGKRGFILFKEYESIENDSLVIVDGDGDEWTYIKNPIQEGQPPLEALSFAGPDDKVFDIRIAPDGLRIVFGNDTFGKKPTSDLTVEWIESSGEELSIMATGLDFEFVSFTLEDDLNVTPANTYEYSMVNDTIIDGGQVSETPDDIKIKAPEYFKTSNNAITREDFNFWVLQSGIGGIIDVNTYGEHERGIDFMNMNNVWITYLTTTGTDLSLQEKELLRDYLHQISYLNVHPICQLANMVKVQMNISIKRSGELEVSDSEAFAYIRSQLVDRFEYNENSIKAPVYHSEIVEWLQNLTITKDGKVQNIAKFVTLNMKALEEFSTPFETIDEDVTFSVGTDGDLYELVLDSDSDQQRTFQYTQQTGDTVDDIVDYFVNEIDAISFYTATNEGSGVLNIQVSGTSGSFTITNEGSTDTDNILILQEIQIPPKVIYNPNDNQLFKPDTIEVITDDGTVLSNDDGSGNLFDGTGSFDYVTGEAVVPLQSTGTYYIRYQQDDTQNILTNEYSVLDFIEPKDKFSDSTETLTTIEFR